ncbi:YebC/PmpR family DNA-binding transcriptional regulator [Cytophagaceae bacterium ABcell3]|nr:YebC/PmpR family DNA-binding transcriptional regulator [Cytophagaceae bacterium ABcell3]
MGRAFEFRRARKEKRWDKMAKTFSKYGKEIALAVKQGGPEVETNPRLRVVIQNAKSENMPKDKIEAAIKRASSKDEKDYEEVVYEGYGPHGIAFVIETATDNPTRTVASIRLYFDKAGGSLGKTGSLEFLFERKGIFRLNAGNLNLEDLELELIDFGAEEINQDGDIIYIETSFTDFGTMQKALEDKKLDVISSELQRIPNTLVEVSEAQAEEINNLIDKFEEDDDVQAVYTNMQPLDI